MIRKELLGQDVEIIQATNKDLQGLQGEIIDETKNTLRIKTNHNEKTVLKNAVTIKVNNHVIDAKLLIARPHERTKIKLTQWHKKTNQ